MNQVTEQQLHAYVDGQLPEQQKQQVEAWLKSHPQDAKRVQHWQQINRQLQQQFEEVQQQPVPVSLTQSLEQHSIGWPKFSQAMAAAVLLFSFGVFTGSRMSVQHDVALPMKAISAHQVFSVDVRHPVEVAASEQQHLLAWLSKRLNRHLVAPDLQTLGYDLLGGRLLDDQQQPAAQLMYQNESGQRLTLYVRASQQSEQTRFDWLEQNGVNAFYWQSPDMAYALVAGLPRDQLQRLAHQVFAQLSI